MNDEQIDAILRRAQTPSDVDPALLDRVVSAMTSDSGRGLEPVRPLPPPWKLEAGLLLICAAVALLGAARAGFDGLRLLSGYACLLMFPVLATLAWTAAAAFVSEMIPGSSRRVGPAALVVAATVTLLGIYAFLFRDYRTGRFLYQGVICIAAGLMHAVPTAIASCWLLKRGFAVNSATAGLAAGALAGLTGVTMLELHCVDFQAPHRLIWHASVLPLSALAGWWLLRSRLRFEPRMETKP